MRGRFRLYAVHSKEVYNREMKGRDFQDFYGIGIFDL